MSRTRASRFDRLRCAYRRTGQGGAIATVAAIALMVAVPTASAATATKAAATTNVTLQLNYVPNAAFAPYFAAVKQGYFAKQGLNVTIRSGTGSGTALETLGAGKATFAIADSSAMINADQGGGKFTMVMMLADGGVLNVFTKKSSNITTMKDLVGKTIGAAPDDAGRLLMPAVAKKNGFNVNQIKYVNVPPETKYALLGAGKIDAVFDIAQNAPLIYTALGGKQNTRQLSFSGAGVNPYSQGIVAPASTVASNPQLIQKFTYAVRQGWQYAILHPTEAMNIYHAQFPSIPVAQGVSILKIWSSLMNTPSYHQHGIGWMLPARWKSTVSLVQKYFPVPKGGTSIKNPAALMTDKFLTPKVSMP